MRKTAVFGFLCFLLLVITQKSVRAEYFLPYPSAMPGNMMYAIERIADVMKHYWYFGTIAQIKYRIGLSDKYLVEADVLFRHKQFLLAVDALKRSDEQLFFIEELMRKGEEQKKKLTNLKELLSFSVEAQLAVLGELINDMPEKVTWRPEKASETDLPIQDLLFRSIKIRNDAMDAVKQQKSLSKRLW